MTGLKNGSFPVRNFRIHRYSIVPIALATFVAFEVLHVGLPALWHDWRIPADPSATGPWLASFFEGWIPSGIGASQAYPTFYLIGFLLWPFHLFATSFAFTVAIVVVTVALTAAAAMRLACNLRAVPLAQVAVALFACLNPWVYSKYVAGHILMIFSYAVMLALLAESTSAKPRRSVMIVLAAFSISQIEFFLIAAPLVLIWSLQRRMWTIALAVVCTAAPIAFGMAASYRDVRGTPFNLSWQRSQSVELGQATILQGYVGAYARAFVPLVWFSLALAVAALVGIPRVLRDRRYAAAVAVSAGALLSSSGTRGPLAMPYTWLVIHVPEIGVYRELYDLVGVVAIGYVVLLAGGVGRSRIGGAMLFVAVCSFVFPWVTQPPTNFFLDAGRLPRPVFPANPTARIALEPAFQPLTADGRGSGVDPDAYPRAGYAVPINEVMPAFPVDSALGFATFRHEERYLRALGVGAVIARPYLQTNFATLRYQWIAMNARTGAANGRVLDALPLLTVSRAEPGRATIANHPDEAAVFFGDVGWSRLGRFWPDRSTNDAKASWVDARLAVPMHPQWGNAFGGVATQSAAPLALALPSAGTSLLAETDGRLADERGRTVVRRSDDLHWWPLRSGMRSLRCYGTCVVALQAAIPAGLPEHRPMGAFRACDVHFATPWLGSATLEPGTQGTLRLNVRYADAWQAFVADRPLAHVRLDTTLNAWHLGAQPAARATTVTFVETVAAWQFALEILAAAAILALALFEALRHRARQ